MTFTPHYKLVPGSAGSFLCPPGHPAHRYTLEGYETTRKRNPFSIGSIEQALADDFDGSDYIKDRVRRIFEESTLTESDLWVRSVYGYFRNMYVPEDDDRSVAKLISYSRPEIAADKVKTILDKIRKAAAEVDEPGLDNYRRGVTPLYGRRRGWEVTAAPDGTKVYIYALADDGTRYDADHLDQFAAILDADPQFTDVTREHICDKHAGRVEATLTDPPAPMDPERHAAVACIRKYFPNHTPRLDLIDNPGKGYGSYDCTKCGERVQYEAKFDKLTKVTTRIQPGGGGTEWTYTTDCTKGGDHEI